MLKWGLVWHSLSGFQSPDFSPIWIQMKMVAASSVSEDGKYPHKALHLLMISINTEKKVRTVLMKQNVSVI